MWVQSGSTAAMCWVCRVQRVSIAAVCWVCRVQRVSTAAVCWVCTVQRVSTAAVCWVCRFQRVSTAAVCWVCRFQRVSTAAVCWVCTIDTERHHHINFVVVPSWYSFGEIRTTLNGTPTDRSVPASWLVQLIMVFQNIQFGLNTNKTFSYEQWQTPFPSSSPYKRHPMFILSQFFAAVSTTPQFSILCSLRRGNSVCLRTVELKAYIFIGFVIVGTDSLICHRLWFYV
jgi:hypothetical protein